MELIRIVIVFSAILLTGYTVLSIIYRDKKIDLCEGIALIMSLGAGSVGILLFWLSLIGIKPSFNVMFSLLLMSGTIAAILLYAKKNATFAIPAKPKKNELIMFIVAGIICFVLLSMTFAHSVMLPIFDVDAFGLWILKTKILINEGIYSKEFHSLPISYSHLNYPLMVPFLMSSFYSAVYETNDILSKLIFPFTYIALGLLMFSTLRWKLNRIHSILLSTLFLSMPALIRWVGAGIADVPLTLFYIGSIHYLVRYIKKKTNTDMVLAILFTVFCAFCKNEGIAIAIINLMVFCFFNTLFPFSKVNLRNSIYFACGVGILMIPWILWSQGLPHTHENYPDRIFNIFSDKNLKRIYEIISLFAKHTIFYDQGILRWGILWLILPFAAIINYQKFKEKYVIAMWALFILHIGAYFFVFIISPWGPQFLADMALERIFLHASPALIYLIAYHLSDKTEQKE